MSWIIEAVIGLLMGALAHMMLRSAGPAGSFGTLLVGILGAIAASKLVALGPMALGVHWLAAIIGGLVLALLWEALFLGRRRSRVIGG